MSIQLRRIDNALCVQRSLSIKQFNTHRSSLFFFFFLLHFAAHGERWEFVRERGRGGEQFGALGEAVQKWRNRPAGVFRGRVWTWKVEQKSRVFPLGHRLRSRAGERVALPLPVLQARRWGLPYPLHTHVDRLRHAALLDGVGTRSVHQPRTCQFLGSHMSHFKR